MLTTDCLHIQTGCMLNKHEEADRVNTNKSVHTGSIRPLNKWGKGCDLCTQKHQYPSASISSIPLVRVTGKLFVLPLHRIFKLSDLPVVDLALQNLIAIYLPSFTSHSDVIVYTGSLR